MKLLWAKESVLNLQQIEDFIASDNPGAAIRLVNKLISLAETIVENPERGRIVPELSINNIREILYKNYRIVYVHKNKSIEILTVFESHKILSSKDLENLT